ncbi:peptide-methionine (R)-S-oxide reductase MsrB [Candidatus Woesearchaeota archaeon]|nr:peptide-methionine (R)-S-oxide reductase MsrB [Candidatus Woesearchaeota archaeon]
MKVLLILTLVLLSACALQFSEPEQKVKTPVPKNITIKKATFAGGCFWCMEHPFESLEGVYNVTSGFANGNVENPTYKQVTTGHREAIQIEYDSEKVTYKELLDIYWHQIDPADPDGSFVDRGFQYTSAIFYHDKEQKKVAEESLKLVQKRFNNSVATKIEAFKVFYPAEDYHQDYYKKRSLKYKFYRGRSGRDKFIKNNWDNSSIWGEEEKKYSKPSDEELKNTLTPLQYKVTQEDGTEQAFNNEYWNNTKPGIYVDIVSGEPLFSSIDKYKSGTGWPSFTQPLEIDNIVTKKDYNIFGSRTEVRSNEADSHIGHIFKDGPEPSGLRYCMNSAAMRFIPADKLEEEGYGQYKALFT